MASKAKSSGVSTSAAAFEVKRLRDEAAHLLQLAAACTDLARRDMLTRAALISIHQAHRLVNAFDNPPQPAPGTSLH